MVEHGEDIDKGDGTVQEVYVHEIQTTKHDHAIRQKSPPSRLSPVTKDDEFVDRRG